MAGARAVRTVGLVVPGLQETGGVATVARFLKDAIHRDGRFRVQLVSLAMGSRDPCNVSLAKPATWRSGPAIRHGTWEGAPFVHVGSVFGELETQRFKPRAHLSKLLADVDVIQVVSGIPAWACPVIGIGKPVALQTATLARVERARLTSSSVAAHWRRLMSHLIDPLDRRALREVDVIQVENPWMLDLANKLNPERRVDIQYAPPGIDDQVFTPGDRSSSLSDPYVLCVGRLDDPRKNVVLLLEALARFQRGRRALPRLVLAGAGGPPTSFWRRAEQLGLRDRVTFLQQPGQQDLIDLYRRAALFVLPSHEEGLGLVLLEAMACAVPVVSTRSGGPDAIITDGEDGFLVELDDAVAIADRMQMLLTDKVRNRTMGVRARHTIEARYSQEAAARPFLNVWERLTSA